MRKLVLMMLVLVFCVMTVLPVAAETEAEQNAPVALTDEQKEELKELNQDILEKKKELISKYVEFGVFEKEQGDKIIAKMEERFEKLEKNGFIPKWDRSKRKHHE